MSRSHLIVAAGVSAVLAFAPLVVPFPKRLVLNTTSSVPLGLYWLHDQQPKVGELALVRPPPGLARWMAQRRYLPLNVPAIKRVAATEGQFICIKRGVVIIDGAGAGMVLKRDRLGRALPSASVCRRLMKSEVFFLNQAPRSLDGRYFGPLTRRSVVGRVTPLWTWGR